ncbi:3-hydroxybutyrate dehydrogenase [Asticcacaulis sp. BYS171W]|uniref:3-hydroxybutyrate dehydrogenase n=1 Tax=Asticcacaulis aquaticus TaxID=2984212 RepID=A0ABT5HT41_9CAUL|nr:3-hydroxybutyrate dehydrogenase [Asticcacaulis aquaticus]MDC7683123.1 3-hydroxybutyrate dehydrogenase [Asticcacaulis aquaticus]
MLSGKTALVTGSTSGIGLAIARKLAANGAKIMLNGMGNPDDIENIRAGIAAEFGVEVCFNGADLTKPDQIATLISDAHERLGGLDVLVNNAGIQFVSPIEDFPIEKWDAIIALNLSSAFHTTRLSFKAMKDKGWGRIVNIASAHALVASPFKSAYVAAKHGIAGLTKTIALEGAEHGITCNAICPGYVLTPLVEKQIPDTAKARGITEEEVVKNVLLAAQPTKKFVETDDIAELVVFLCSDAGRSITGSLQSIDGGWTAA